jgi:hypothetical protein
MPAMLLLKVPEHSYDCCPHSNRSFLVVFFSLFFRGFVFSLFADDYWSFVRSKIAISL